MNIAHVSSNQGCPPPAQPLTPPPTRPDSETISTFEKRLTKGRFPSLPSGAKDLLPSPQVSVVPEWIGGKGPEEQCSTFPQVMESKSSNGTIGKSTLPTEGLGGADPAEASSEAKGDFRISNPGEGVGEILGKGKPSDLFRDGNVVVKSTLPTEGSGEADLAEASSKAEGDFRISNPGEGVGEILGKGKAVREGKDGGGEEAYQPASAGIMTPASQVGGVTSTHSPSLALESARRIEELVRLITETASAVSFDSGGSASIQLSQDQLPDSSIMIRIDSDSVKITFQTMNPTSIAILQARGGEVAGALFQRFQREITVSLLGDRSSPEDQGTLLGSSSHSSGGNTQGELGSSLNS